MNQSYANKNYFTEDSWPAIIGLACCFPDFRDLKSFGQAIFSLDINELSNKFNAKSLTTDQYLSVKDILAKSILDAVKDINGTSTVQSNIEIVLMLDKKQNLDIWLIDLRELIEQISQQTNCQFHKVTICESTEFQFYKEWSKQENEFLLLVSIGSNKNSKGNEQFAAAACLLANNYKHSDKIYALLGRAFDVGGVKYIANWERLDEIQRSQIIILINSMLLCSSFSLDILQKTVKRNEIESLLNNLKNILPQEHCYELLHFPAKPYCAITASSLLTGDFGVVNKIADIIISALALQQRIIPGAPKIENEIQVNETSSFYLPIAPRPWIHPVSPREAAFPRTACVLAGENVLLPLKEYANQNINLTNKLIWKFEHELLIFEGNNPQELFYQLQDLQRKKFASLQESAAYAAKNYFNNKDRSYRLSMIVQSVEDLVDKIQIAQAHLRNCPDEDIPLSTSRQTGIYYKTCLSEPGKVAFVLPGLGAAYPNMLLDLCFCFPEVREVLDFVERLVLVSGDKFLPSRQIYPLQTQEGYCEQSNPAKLAVMDSAVVSVLLAEWAIYCLLNKIGIKSDILVGCSTGEFAALTMNGSIDILDEAKIFYKLSTMVSRSIAPSGLAELRSLRINASYEAIKPFIDKYKEEIFLAAELSYSSILVSGYSLAIEQFVNQLKQVKIDFIFLPVAIPYHTSLVSNKLDSNQPEIDALSVVSPKIMTLSCSEALEYPSDPDEIKKLSTHLFEKPILFCSTIELAYEKGARNFLEVGPKGSLTSYINEILAGKEHIALATNLQGHSALEQFLHTIAALASVGLPVNSQALFDWRVSWQNVESLFSVNHTMNNAGLKTNKQDVMISYFNLLQDFHTQLMDTQEKILSAYLARDDERQV